MVFDPQLLPVELESRWLMLVKTYRECVDYNLTNNTEDKCEYYDEISDVYDYSSNGIKVERQEEEEVIGKHVCELESMEPPVCELESMEPPVCELESMESHRIEL